jgi:general secretion pathway protein G
MFNQMFSLKMKCSDHGSNFKELPSDDVFSRKEARPDQIYTMFWISHTNRGVSFLELMMVVCIIAIASGIAVPAYTGHRDKLDTANAVADMTGMGLLIEKFYAENNRYPNSLGEIGKGGLKDPWGREYQYQNNAVIMANDKKHKCTGCRKDGPVHPINTDFDLFSVGKDGKSNDTIRSQPSQDDIIRAFNGSYIGIARDII